MFFDKRFKSTLLTSVSMGAVLIGTNALANPEGANVVTGDVAINGLGTDHVIIQNDSNRAVVNWDKFSIGAGETTTINQITDDSAILNRVITNNVSEIYGTLESNGQVFLVNQSGIVIGEGGIVDTNGLIASTLDVSNTDFLGAGEMIFSQGIEKAGGIEIHGKVRSVSGGDIFLLSREITIGSTAEISSEGGYVGLGAGEEILLRPTDTGQGRISIRAGKGKIANQGAIAGAVAELKAAGGNEYALAINNTGVVRATGFSKKGGKIRLGGGGKIRNKGKLVARKKVIVRSKKKIVNEGRIKAGDGNQGGEIIFEAPEIEVKTDSILDVAGALGGGRIFVGGGYQGTQGDHDGNAVDITENAIKVTVDSGAVLTASATQSGDAGEIVVWADGETVVAGDIVATAAQGRGGDVEVSGKDTLNIAGMAVDLRGSEGNGTLLLDPTDMTIIATGVTAANQILDSDLETLLATTSTTISTNAAGADDGNVTFEAGVRVSWVAATSLTVKADKDINALDDVVIQHSGSANTGTGVVFLANNDINIGKDADRTGGVEIGSRFGQNIYRAGDSDHDGVVDKTGNVNIIGGDNLYSYAHLGYVQGPSGTSSFNNGNISVEAGGDVTLQGGDELGSFAQIGHGGSSEYVVVGNISANIDVKSDADGDGAGNVILTHAEKDSDVTNSSSGTHAQIGHGSLVITGAADVAIVHGSIEGNITVATGKDDGTTADLNINTTFTASADGNEDEYRSKIGHGGTLIYVGTTTAKEGTTVNGEVVDGIEATHGDISGDITLDINGKVNLGTSAAPGAADDQFLMHAQIGHGGLIGLNYRNNLQTDTDDHSFDAFHGDISGAINVTATQVNLIAKDAAQNSAASDGTIVDNYQQSQIGHGSTTVFNRDVTISGGDVPAGTEIDLDGNRFDELSTTPNAAGESPLDAEVDDAEAELAALETGLDTQTEEAVALNSENEVLKETKIELEARQAELQAKVDATPPTITAAEQAELDTLNATGMPVPAGSIAEKTGEITAKEAEIAAKQVEIDNTTSDIEDLAAEFEELQAFLDGEKTPITVDESDGIAIDVARNITVTDNRISGDIIITDDTADDAGVTLEADIAAGLNAITKDVMVARIGHGSIVGVDSLHGSESKTVTLAITDNAGVDALNGGNVTIRQAHILGADITVDTATHGDADDDIKLVTNVAAGLGAAEDNTAVTQIGHGGDVFVSTGDGGASTRDDINSGDGGDITLIRGTVWDGGLVRDDNGAGDDNLFIAHTTDITIKSSSEVIVQSDTAAALASAERNNAESQIGHGFKQRLVTGDGGTSTGNGAAGGAGGDILVYQGLDVREYGVNNDRFDDYAYGLRGDIRISATHKEGIAINLTSDDSSALAKTDFNTDTSTIGHGDVLEAVSGKGGDGSSGLDQEGDFNDPTQTGHADFAELDEDGQAAVYGGRGGHIDVQLGRHTGLDQYGSTGGSDMFGDTRIAGGNQADLGDTRALTLGGVAAPKRQGLSLIEGDIFVNVLGGTVNVAGSINNALSPSEHAVSESIIGHTQRFTADAGDGGAAGNGNFNSQPETVFETEQQGEAFLNYAAGSGSNRGGNGGDVRLTHGDITDRIITHRIGDNHAEITHDTDADHSGTSVTFVAGEGYSQDNDYIDGSSDIFMYLHDEATFGDDATAQDNADSLIVKSTINAGLSESNGSIYSTVGHHVRLIGEGGIGGNGGETNTEFDQDGNSLFIDATGQTDVIPASEGVDETAIQAGAVYIQPNASGGRGGDALVVNNNISGDVVINAARRVTVRAGDGHGGATYINATLGHTSDLFSITQAGGAGGNLIEPAGTNVTFDGGIINVGGGQSTDNGENSSTTSATSSIDKEAKFDHVLIDGNRDDEFNLENNGNSQSIASEDGIAIAEDDITNRTGSTFASIHNDPALGSNPIGNTDAVIFHDEEADPQYIKDDAGDFVLNDATNNALYAENAENLGRYGRVVATYDGTQTQNPDEFFSLVGAPGNEGRISLEVFVDMDQDGDVDLVDFDRDGRLDIVDVDRDGKMDVIDGRANYVDVRNAVSVPKDDGVTNRISGLGVLDYVAVTGKGFNQADAADGEYWTNHNELRSDDLLVDYNNNNDLLSDTTSGEGSDFVAYVSDFSTSNGGRGGDAYSQVGYTSGDISVSTGNNDEGEADTLIVKTIAPDAIPGNGSDDFIRAIIGHNGVQLSDAGGEYAAYRVGREGLNMDSTVHSAADGGAAGDYAINGNGGRGGNAALIQGATRDLHAALDGANLLEMDHLVGDIFINTPNYLDNSISNDSGRISITGEIGSLTPASHFLVSQIGHGSLAATAAGNGGVGASAPKEEDGSSQTELADGGDGGDAYLTQHQVKGDITVMAAADKEDEFSILMSATDAHPVPGDNVIIAQIGHGRQTNVLGGHGGDGDDGQFRGNGGAGGNATLTQNNILDSEITIDLVDVDRGYDGNGMQMLAESVSGANDIFRVQVGHGDISGAEAGSGGDGTPQFNVFEQRNQTANGGTGGDAIINQAGYSNDITLDIGSNEAGAEALQVLTNMGITNGTNDHLLATIGHGGFGVAFGGDGGTGGLNGDTTGIPSEADPNLIDGDYFNIGGNTHLVSDGDSAGAIDVTNQIFLGTTRRGGDAGDGVVNQNINGTGRTLSGREVASNDYGVDDADGADIKITVNDEYSDEKTPEKILAGSDGVLIQTKIGPGSNQDSSLFVNSAQVGHHNFAEATGGTGGDGIPGGAFSATISDGDGGDGGTGVTNIEEVRGDISIENTIGVTNEFTAALDNSDSDKDTNITIETINATASDGAEHRGDARVGHMSQAQSTGGKGGRSAREAGDVPSYPATISTQGGDGGDALAFQGQQEGDINLEAENSVIVSARDTTVGAGALIAGAGHRLFAEAKAGDGNFGGTYDGDGEDESTYFTYEALREFHYRRTSGASDDVAFNELSQFEQKLVAPVTDYFENKQGELEIFLDRLVGDHVEVIAHNERDDNYLGKDAGGNDINVTIPTLVTGAGHIDGADDGEVETLRAILAAAGHGGNASVTQGSKGLSGFDDELAASGDIKLTANAFYTNDTSDTKRGIVVEGVAGSVGASFQLGHVGHQSEAHEVVAGKGSNLSGINGDENGIGGDGGDAIVDQYALNGSVDLVSNHEILVSALDASPAGHETRAWVGHRLTIGSDYTVYRSGDSVVSGDGGSESGDSYDDGHNGNGGDVFISQRGVISGETRGSSTEQRYDTEISLAALEDADDDISITIQAVAPGPAAPDVETHVGHDFLIHGVKAGDAGRQGTLTGPVGAAEGLLEGNGGDIFIAQTDLGADIDIVGRDTVVVNASSSLGNQAHLMIGHERTIGNSAESSDALDGGVADNPRSGTIKAGFGGDSHIEDVNGTARASREAAADGVIEDADSGRIEIALGKLTDSVEADGDDTRLVTITSITEDVDVTSLAATGSKSILEIGNQQQVIAETQSASEYTGIPLTQTAGDAGGIFINRDTIDGDILIQAIDADRANSNVPGEGKQVVIDSTSGAGSTAITQIGHETQFDVKTSTPVTKRAALGEDRNFLHETNLTNYVGLDDAGTGTAGEATLRDAQNAVEDMRDVVRALELATENADRFPADDGVAEAAGVSADQGEIFTLLGQARSALSSAEADLNSIGHGVDDPSEAGAINAVMGHAEQLVTAATDYQTILDANIVPEAGDQIADFAEGGDIVYGSLGTLALDGNNGLNSHTDSITGVAGIAQTDELSIQHAPSLTVEGFTVADTGIVEGKVDILSGRDSSLTDIDLKSVTDVIGNDTIVADNFGGEGFTPDDDLDDSVVQITATADSRSLTEIGHRRIMTNETSFGGGDTDGAGGTEEGGVAGDAGSIVVSNTTRGDITVQAEEVVIQTAGAAGDAELHLLHSSHTTNTAGWSDLQSLVGNGGDIYNTTTVSGGVSINAEQIASAVDAKDRKILATGLANTFIHMGHQAEDKNESKSDPNETGNKGDTQDNLGSNRGGKVVSSQSVTGNSADDLVIITLDAAGDGNASDLILETANTGKSDIRLGNGEDGGMKGIYQDGTSGINQSDDGGEIELTQVVSGDIEISKIEDLHINNIGAGGDENIYIGHDAEQFGESGQTNAPAGTINQYGERVTVTQTVTGNVNVTTTSSYTASLAAAAGEIHVGHEATQSAFSADDSDNPSDLEDTDNNGIADNGENGAEGSSATGVNDNFNQPDVMATQVIEAGISIVTGEITLENKGDAKAKLIHYGHEATHKAAVDGDLTDKFDGTNQSVTGTSVANGSTGHVVASSKINADGSDILFVAQGSSVQNDSIVDPSPVGIAYGTEGDIQLNSTDKGTIQVGHSSTSTMGDVTDGLVKEGQFNAEQIIGTSALDSNGNEVADTSQSVIEFRAAQDIILASVDGETQVGHFIVEEGNVAHLPGKDPLDVDGDATTGLAQGDSELRQIVGSDILIGDNQGTGGAGNNVIIETGAAGRTMIGHQSPETNEWQLDGTRSVTVQLLDGDINIEAGTDTGVDAPDGTVIASAADAIKDETGDGDDLLLLSGGGEARIGHNMAGFEEGVLNETQRSAGNIWVRARGDALIDGGNIGHEHYDFDAIAASKKNATPESLASATPIRNRIRGLTTISAGQNSPTEDSTLQADILKIDGSTNPVKINSGYGGQGEKDVAGQLRFFLPAQENLTIINGVEFNDSLSNSDAVPDRTSNLENVFENEGGNNHEHYFALASETADYTDEFIGAGNFTFYFQSAPVQAEDPQITPSIFRVGREQTSGFNVSFITKDNDSGGVLNTGGLFDDYIGTSSYEVSCEERGADPESCGQVDERYDGIQPGYGSNTKWSGQAGGSSSRVIETEVEDDLLNENRQVVGFTVYDEPVITPDYQEPVITTQSVAVERSSQSYFKVKTVTTKLPTSNNRVITRNSPAGINQISGFGRTVTNPQPLGHFNSSITTSTEGAGVNGFDVSNNAVFSTTTHQFFTGYIAGNDYQVTPVENTIGTYVDDTGLDAYMSKHAGAMSFASSYQVFEGIVVE